ncbi:aspartate/glutamate racemase family protein [Alloscardovia sp. HMSC034E08]|uniref:aspartate/glutamate racemase family protein n=1 Tax=Alloscardovia sp. HMSC034E08 TaxID=1739413 RepID=UPI0008ABE8F1|nr:amino acid racemase [Alloscardovia sp. HMSC034E08]OFQ99939.1 aspartate racemase [Alloscardovia sp. HMSC034E08]
MYKGGVIGGMGPLATVEFYNRLVRKSPANSDNEHADVIILNHATIPDRTRCIMNHRDDDFLNAIRPDFDLLNSLGVKVIAIPCNTSHYYYDKLCEFTDIPIVNMVESSIIEAKKRGFTRACVFCTEGTASSGIYERYALKHGLTIVELDEADRTAMMDTIYSIKAKNSTEGEKLNDVISQYCDAQTVGIIACTELSLIDLDEANKPLALDALDVLVARTLEYLYETK